MEGLDCACSSSHVCCLDAFGFRVFRRAVHDGVTFVVKHAAEVCHGDEKEEEEDRPEACVRIRADVFQYSLRPIAGCGGEEIREMQDALPALQ